MVRPEMTKYFGFKSCGRMWYTCGTKLTNPDKSRYTISNLLCKLLIIGYVVKN
jgi:hypothetical protein